MPKDGPSSERHPDWGRGWIIGGSSRAGIGAPACWRTAAKTRGPPEGWQVGTHTRCGSRKLWPEPRLCLPFCSFGAMVYSPRTGILLNNELLDLCWRSPPGSSVAPPPSEPRGGAHWGERREGGQGGCCTVAPGAATPTRPALVYEKANGNRDGSGRSTKFRLRSQAAGDTCLASSSR